MRAKAEPDCTCGRSLFYPNCDGSHGRSVTQYAEWKAQIEKERKEKESITLPAIPNHLSK